MPKPSLKFYLFALIQFIAILYLGYGLDQSDFIPLISTFGLAFGMYLLAFYYTGSNTDLDFLIGCSILFRAVLIFSFPNLSDDIYRFIWDGNLIINGINPFGDLPSTIIDSGKDLRGITPDLYEKLNSPDYYTIYPPIAQLINVIAVSIFPTNWWGAAIVMKLFLFAFEVGNIFLVRQLLQKFAIPTKNVLLYALNPLIIIEIVGNLHFEGGMIFFLLLGFYCLVQSKRELAAVSMAFSVASKLLPLLFMPFLIRRLGWLRSWRFFTIMGVVLLLLFLPLLSGTFLQNFGNSLDLYFRKFEFNASIYYVFRWIGYQTRGFNLIQVIGPRLAIAVFVIIILASLIEKGKDWKSWPGLCLLAITTYLFLGTTIHPWYVSLPLILCLFTRFRFPVLWSGLIMMTYINYSYTPYFENLWIVGIEYGLVFGFLAYELWRERPVFKRNIETPSRP